MKLIKSIFCKHHFRTVVMDVGRYDMQICIKCQKKRFVDNMEVQNGLGDSDHRRGWRRVSVRSLSLWR